MKKWIFLFLIATMFPTIINSSVTPAIDLKNYHLSAYEEIQVKMTEYEEELQRQLWLQEIQRFLDDIGFQESGNNWKRYNIDNDGNELGYIGKYQFGYAARKATGYGHIHYWAWRNNPHIWPEHDQDTAMVRYMKYNKKDLQHHITDIDTLTLKINGVVITESGILAAAHLAGSGNVNKFFNKRGKYNPKDLNGTSLVDYLTTYSGYDFNLAKI